MAPARPLVPAVCLSWRQEESLAIITDGALEVYPRVQQERRKPEWEER